MNMKEVNFLDDKLFIDCCFTLSVEDIYDLNRDDNGPINNVIKNIDDHCFGVKLFDDEIGLSAHVFYINNKMKLDGDIICLEVLDKNYDRLLFSFCDLLEKKYNIGAINAFNTFQKKLRGFLELRGFFTVSNLELKPYLGSNSIMVSNVKRGIYKITFLESKEFYSDFFGNLDEQEIEDNADYVYLMINEETSLIKIGASKNPKYREGTLHSKEPTVHLFALWKTNRQLEKLLHKEFNEKRIRGEWFKLNFSDLEILNEMVIKYMNNNDTVETDSLGAKGQNYPL